MSTDFEKILERLQNVGADKLKARRIYIDEFSKQAWLDQVKTIVEKSPTIEQIAATTEEAVIIKHRLDKITEAYNKKYFHESPSYLSAVQTSDDAINLLENYLAEDDNLDINASDLWEFAKSSPIRFNMNFDLLVFDYLNSDSLESNIEGQTAEEILADLVEFFPTLKPATGSKIGCAFQGVDDIVEYENENIYIPSSSNCFIKVLLKYVELSYPEKYQEFQNKIEALISDGRTINAQGEVLNTLTTKTNIIIRSLEILNPQIYNVWVNPNNTVEVVSRNLNNRVATNPATKMKIMGIGFLALNKDEIHAVLLKNPNGKKFTLTKDDVTIKLKKTVDLANGISVRKSKRMKNISSEKSGSVLNSTYWSSKYLNKTPDAIRDNRYVVIYDFETSGPLKKVTVGKSKVERRESCVYAAGYCILDLKNIESYNLEDVDKRIIYYNCVDVLNEYKSGEELSDDVTANVLDKMCTDITEKFYNILLNKYFYKLSKDGKKRDQYRGELFLKIEDYKSRIDSYIEKIKNTKDDKLISKYESNVRRNYYQLDKYSKLLLDIENQSNEIPVNKKVNHSEIVNKLIDQDKIDIFDCDSEQDSYILPRMNLQFFAHNGNNFDSHFFMKLIKLKRNAQAGANLIKVGCNLKGFKLTYNPPKNIHKKLHITLKDTLPFVQCNLKTLTGKNLKYPKQDFDIGSYNDFTDPLKNDDMMHYLKYDVKSLAESFLQYEQGFLRDLGLSMRAHIGLPGFADTLTNLGCYGTKKLTVPNDPVIVKFIKDSYIGGRILHFKKKYNMYNRIYKEKFNLEYLDRKYKKILDAHKISNDYDINIEMIKYFRKVLLWCVENIKDSTNRSKHKKYKDIFLHAYFNGVFSTNLEYLGGKYTPLKKYKKEVNKPCRQLYLNYFGSDETRPKAINLIKDRKIGLISIDMNSLYPSIMSALDFPINDMYLIKSDVSLTQIKRIYKRYILEVEIKFPKWRYGIYPYKTETSSLLYPGKGLYRGVWNDIDLTEMEKDGAVIKKIYQGIGWKSSGRVFEVMDKLWDMRANHQINDNEVGSYICKITMNSIYGKFGELIRERKFITKSNKGVSNKYNGIVDNILPISPDQEMITTKEKILKTTKPMQIASYVTSGARALVNDIIRMVGVENVYYSDTDSIYIERKVLKDKQISEKINGLCGYKNDYGEGSVIDKSYFLDSKRYLLNIIKINSVENEVCNDEEFLEKNTVYKFTDYYKCKFQGLKFEQGNLVFDYYTDKNRDGFVEMNDTIRNITNNDYKKSGGNSYKRDYEFFKRNLFKSLEAGNVIKNIATQFNKTKDSSVLIDVKEFKYVHESGKRSLWDRDIYYPLDNLRKTPDDKDNFSKEIVKGCFVDLNNNDFFKDTLFTSDGLKFDVGINTYKVDKNVYTRTGINSANVLNYKDNAGYEGVKIIKPTGFSNMSSDHLTDDDSSFYKIQVYKNKLLLLELGTSILPYKVPGKYRSIVQKINDKDAEIMKYCYGFNCGQYPENSQEYIAKYCEVSQEAIDKYTLTKTDILDLLNKLANLKPILFTINLDAILTREINKKDLATLSKFIKVQCQEDIRIVSIITAAEDAKKVNEEKILAEIHAENYFKELEQQEEEQHKLTEESD